eukprot:1464926-Pleurochrysis_carterae.AAC.1
MGDARALVLTLARAVPRAIGVLAVRVIGTERGASTRDPQLREPSVPLSSLVSAPSEAEPTTLDAGVSVLLDELYASKEAAVAAEAYDEAKKIKIRIDGLREVGMQLAELERRKTAA